VWPPLGTLAVIFHHLVQREVKGRVVEDREGFIPRIKNRSRRPAEGSHLTPKPARTTPT